MCVHIIHFPEIFTSVIYILFLFSQSVHIFTTLISYIFLVLVVVVVNHCFTSLFGTNGFSFSFVIFIFTMYTYVLFSLLSYNF